MVLRLSPSTALTPLLLWLWGVSVWSAFYGLCGELVLGALQRLAQQGRCALIPGSVLSETGVKFRGV